MGIFDLVEDLAVIAVAPVVIAADLARVVTKPVAEIAEEMAETVAEIVDDE